MDTQTIDGNKLIAEFMGTKVKPDGYFINNYLYHSSWDWLMPVVEKINDMDYPYEISDCICSIGIFRKDYNNTVRSESNGTKYAVWQAVVEFVQWYNTTKPLTP